MKEETNGTSGENFEIYLISELDTAAKMVEKLKGIIDDCKTCEDNIAKCNTILTKDHIPGQLTIYNNTYYGLEDYSREIIEVIYNRNIQHLSGLLKHFYLLLNELHEHGIEDKKGLTS